MCSAQKKPKAWKDRQVQIAEGFAFREDNEIQSLDSRDTRERSTLLSLLKQQLLRC